MEMTPVESSNVKAIGHDGNTLYVDYKTSGLYYYENVPTETYSAIMKADSKGSALRNMGVVGKKF